MTAALDGHIGMIRSTSKDNLKKLLKEIERREQSLLANSFPEQTAFILDESRFKACLTNRRSGKTTATAIMMIRACMDKPNTKCLYISLTKERARDIMIEPVLRIMNKKYFINANFTTTPQVMRFPNGSYISLKGINDSTDEQEKLLGESFKLIVIDEAASYTIDLKKIINDFIRPCLIDQLGTLCLVGTPSDMQGHFCDVTEGRVPGWSIHKWLARDNPYVAKQWQEEVDLLKKNNPYIEEDPGFRQMYLGEWCVDNTQKVIKLHERNSIPAMPPPAPRSPFEYYLGIDIGENDDNAWVLAGFRDHDPHLYIRESYAENHLTMDEIIKIIKTYQIKYDILEVCIDSANLQYVNELSRRSGIYFQAAQKRDKLKYIQMLNSDLVSGKVLIVAPDNVPLINELNKVIMDYSDPLHPKIKQKQSDHLLDAFLYAWRAATNFLNSVPDNIIPKTESQLLDEYWEEKENSLEDRKTNQTFLDRDFGQ